MDLIYTNSANEDQGVLLDYELDLAFGADENNFECRIASASHCCEAGSMLYIEGTEYGGIIDSIESDSSTDEVIYSGRTWHGVLGSKVIMPLQTGEASTAAVTLKTTDSSGGSLIDRYLIISGDANACIGFILSRVGLSTLFESSSISTGVNINQYQFDRFTDAYKGITKMLSNAGLKPVFSFTDGKVIISAAVKHDFTTDEEFDSDLIEFQAKKNYKTVNHLICLGTGELEKRMVVHLFSDAEGNISQAQTQFGLDEYVATYDYSSVESEDELIASGTEKLQELWNQEELSVDFDESMDLYDVGDIVGAVDSITGLAITATITKKIVKINNGQISIDISTDAVSSIGSGATGNGANNAFTEMINRIYPVGCYYWSSESTNPATVFGVGVWERVKDKFILAAGNTYSVGATGGKANVTLTEAQLPYIEGTLIIHGQENGTCVYQTSGHFTGTQLDGKYKDSGNIVSSAYSQKNPKFSFGSGKSHTNMPPYIAAYCWHRTA